VNRKFNRTGPATATAIPQRACRASEPPSPPANLTAFSSGSDIKLCWKQPPTGGCVNEYRIAYRLIPLTDQEAQTATWKYSTAKTAGCLSIPGLQDRRSYQFAVQSFGAGSSQGAYAGTQAMLVAAWQCMPISGELFRLHGPSAQLLPSFCAFGAHRFNHNSWKTV